MARVEERLTELLEASAPPAAPVDFDQLLARVRRRRRSRLVATVGTGTISVVVAVLLVASAGPWRSSNGSDHPVAAGTGSCLNQLAAGPVIVLDSLPPILGIELVYRGSGTCLVSAEPPTVTVFDSHGHRVGSSSPKGEAGRARLVLTPGSHVRFGIDRFMECLDTTSHSFTLQVVVHGPDGKTQGRVDVSVDTGGGVGPTCPAPPSIGIVSALGAGQG